MAIVQHQSNRADVKDIFTNDFSSKNAGEQQRRKQQEAAANAKTKEAEAKRLEAERVAKEEAIAKKLNEYMEEIEALKVERKEYTAEIETLKTERKDLNSKTEAKRAELEAKRVELETNVKNESEKARRLGTQLEQANTKIFSLENAEKERESAELDPDNDLPLEWHGKVVTFINTCGKTAIDMGNNNAAGMHGWALDWGNHWQTLLLEKVDPNNSKSAWLISNSGSGTKRYLELRNNNGDQNPTCSLREWDSDDQKFQEWNIASNSPGRWMLMNTKWGGWLDLIDQSQGQCGARYRPRGQNPGYSSQNFYLMYRQG